MSRRARRTFTPQFKAEVVLELLTGQRSAAELCRQHQLSPSLLTLWKDTYLDWLHVGFQADEQRSQEQTCIPELEQLVGRQAPELEILKNAQRLLNGRLAAKREVVMSLIQEYPARLVCRLLDFPRYQLDRVPDSQPDQDADLSQALIHLA